MINRTIQLSVFIHTLFQSSEGLSTRQIAALIGTKPDQCFSFRPTASITNLSSLLVLLDSFIAQVKDFVGFVVVDYAQSLLILRIGTNSVLVSASTRRYVI